MNRPSPPNGSGGCIHEFQALVGGVERVIQGKHDIVRLAAICLLAEGHLLLEDVPGTGKTMLARAFAAAVDVDWGRIQFTPDLLPSDITGSLVFNRADSTFVFRRGPVFNCFVIGDEINRASPKTQSALLQVMEERTVSAGDEQHAVPNPFMVIATQNPEGMAGTYPLPEAQLDRFLLKATMGYPDRIEDEIQVVRLHRQRPDVAAYPPVLGIDDVRRMVEVARNVSVGPNVERYIVELARHTRQDPRVQLPVSPRGCVALARASAALAAADGHDYVVPEHAKAMAPHVLTHRIVLRPEAMIADQQLTAADIIDETLDKVSVPDSPPLAVP